MENIVISREEYKGLKQQIKNLKSTVCAIESPRSKIIDLVNELPLGLPRNLEEGRPIFGYRDFYDSAVWTLFVALAKAIHTKNGVFYMSETHTGSGVPYIRCTHSTKVKRLENLNLEQLKMSVDMLNEMIPIFNRYMKKTHKEVVYKANTLSEPICVKVLESILF